MSHKSKKSIEEMREYLGRDVRGVQLLDSVASEMHELRKRGNSERERAEAALNAAAAEKEKSVKLSSNLQETRHELDKCKASLQQLKADQSRKDAEISRLNAEIANLTSGFDDDELVCNKPHGKDKFPTDLLRRSSIIEQFNAIHSRLSKCPACVRKPAGFIAAYNIEDIITDYSASDLIMLGRFVAFMSVMNFSCVIVSEYNARFNEDHEKDALRKRFIGWFIHNIGLSNIEIKVNGPLGVVSNRTDVQRGQEHLSGPR